VTDDVIALDTDRLTVQPAAPAVKIAPTLARRFDAVSLPDAKGGDRQYAPVPDGFPSEPVPLARVYVVEQGPLGEATLPPGRAAYELDRAAFTPFDRDDADAVERRFGRCTRVATAVDTRTLSVPHDVTRLDRAVSTIETSV